MGKVVMSTEYCYEALIDCKDEGEVWLTSSWSDLSDHPGLRDENDIQFSQSAWEDEKIYFGSFLAEAIQAYEKRHRTIVHKIALAGNVGLWNGSPVGGKFLNTDQSPLEEMGDVDDVDVYIHDDHEVVVRGHHHDGSHRMNIYFVPYNLYEKLEHQDYEAFEWLVENRKPLKANTAKGYFGGYQSESVS